MFHSMSPYFLWEKLDGMADSFLTNYLVVTNYFNDCGLASDPTETVYQ